MNSNKLSDKKELELINGYSTVHLTEDKVFRFTVTLCDNEVDRDNERFDIPALKALKELFVGKTGISDHSMRSKDQRARIFHTFIEEDPTQKTSTGENYTVLKARAYMLRTEENKELISEIEGGIKKEVSVSCSVNEHLCSICGESMKAHTCKHIKGRSYNGKKCHAVLTGPTDAYEWSFVAVPAQKNAGVTKSFIMKEDLSLTQPIDIIKSITPGTSLTEAQIRSISDYVEALEKQASEVKDYKAHLTTEIERLSLIVLPKVNMKSFISGCLTMSFSELRQLKEGLEAQAKEKLPLEPQFKAASGKAETNNNTSFRI